jgi:hypothetical protein
MTENTENVVPFVDRPAPQLMSGQRRRDYPPARTRAAKRYVDMLEACSTPLRLEALEMLIGSIDLAGLEYVLHDGELMGVIGEVSVDPEAPPLLQVVVRMQNGWPIDMVLLVAALADEEEAFLRLPGSRETGLAATIEALRARLEGAPQ